MSLYLHLTFKWFSKINLCGTHTTFRREENEQTSERDKANVAKS